MKILFCFLLVTYIFLFFGCEEPNTSKVDTITAEGWVMTSNSIYSSSKSYKREYEFVGKNPKDYGMKVGDKVLFTAEFNNNNKVTLSDGTRLYENCKLLSIKKLE